MTTEATEPTAAAVAATAPKGTWRLETPNGSMNPRSALDVLVDLNDKVTTGKVGEYQPVPLGFTPLDKTIGTGLRAGRAPPDRRGPGHRQDDDGAPDGPQRRLRRPGQRPVHLLRARGAVPAQPAHRDGVGARPPAPQDRRDQDPGRPQGDPRVVGRRRAGDRPADQQPASPAVARPDRPLRPEPVPRPRDADGQHRRQHAQARPAAPRAVRRSAPARRRRLHAEGPGLSPSRRPSPRR